MVKPEAWLFFFLNAKTTQRFSIVIKSITRVKLALDRFIVDLVHQ